MIISFPLVAPAILAPILRSSPILYPAGTLVVVACREPSAELLPMGDVVLLAEADLGPPAAPVVQAYWVQGRAQTARRSA